MGLDFNLIAAKNHLEQLAVDFQFGGKRLGCGIFLLLQFVPKLGEVALDVVVEVFVKGEEARRAKGQSIANRLLHFVHARQRIVHHAVVEVAWPLERHPTREFRRVEHVPIVMGEWEVVGRGVRRLGRHNRHGHSPPSHKGKAECRKDPPRCVVFGRGGGHGRGQFNRQ